MTNMLDGLLHPEWLKEYPPFLRKSVREFLDTPVLTDFQFDPPLQPSYTVRTFLQHMVKYQYKMWYSDEGEGGSFYYPVRQAMALPDSNAFNIDAKGLREPPDLLSFLQGIETGGYPPRNGGFFSHTRDGAHGGETGADILNVGGLFAGAIKHLERCQNPRTSHEKTNHMRLMRNEKDGGGIPFDVMKVFYLDCMQLWRDTVVTPELLTYVRDRTFPPREDLRGSREKILQEWTLGQEQKRQQQREGAELDGV